MDESMSDSEETRTAGEPMTRRKVLFKDFPFGWDQHAGPMAPLTDEEKKILTEIDRVFEETFKCPSN